MRLDDQSPVFRNMIVPWYDSDAACLVVILFLVLIILFALAGVSVAVENPAYHGDIWVPGLLILLSLAVIASTAARLVRRRYFMRTRGSKDRY